MLLKNPHKCLLPHPSFIYDEACLDLVNRANETVHVYGQYDECYECEHQLLATLEPSKNTSLLINSRYSLHLNYTLGQNRCDVDQLFYEHYRYGWNLTQKCGEPIILQPADSAYLPIATAFIILFMFGTFWYMVKCIYRYTKNHRTWQRFFTPSELENDLGNAEAPSLVIERPPPIRKHPNRVKSVDVFRGLAITLMIFVNYGGGKYWFCEHSIWNGITIADLVFPWFMWIMGMSLAISLNNRLRRGVPRKQLLIHIIRRALILIFAGIIVNSHGKTTPLVSLRLPGVLQRLGLCYLIVGVLEATFTKRSVSVTEYGNWTGIKDIVVAWPQWLVMVALLAVHSLVTFAVSIPGCGIGYIGAGGLQGYGHHQNCTGGAAGYIDRQVFGQHLYAKATCRELYETKVLYDPEGLLGTLTATVLVYMGVQAGRILNSYSGVKTRTILWLIWGAVLFLIGLVLCGFSKNGGPVPINKNLWSVSFILVTGGLAFAIQAFLFVVVDITRKWGGRPLFYPGMNPLLLYIGSELLTNTFPFAWTPVNRTHASYLGMNLWGVGVWVVIAITLYKHNIFYSL